LGSDRITPAKHMASTVQRFQGAKNSILRRPKPQSLMVATYSS
jgi:hypothetical protein